MNRFAPSRPCRDWINSLLLLGCSKYSNQVSKAEAKQFLALKGIKSGKRKAPKLIKTKPAKQLPIIYPLSSQGVSYKDKPLWLRGGLKLGQQFNYEPLKLRAYDTTTDLKFVAGFTDDLLPISGSISIPPGEIMIPASGYYGCHMMDGNGIYIIEGKKYYAVPFTVELSPSSNIDRLGSLFKGQLLFGNLKPVVEDRE